MRTKDELMKQRGNNLTLEEIKALGERNRKITEQRLMGKTYSELATEFNLHREYIKTICHKHGVYGNPKTKKKIIKQTLF